MFSKSIGEQLMGRIKWNLDLLEEVKKQHDEAMTATEQVMNNGKSDLSSMTEDVWEGEDGDMARDQLHDLLNKEMVETWKELDACNEAIQKAQKTAYESKNFCNRFPQIFRSGSRPSESDQGACSGDLLCDNDSCSSLKDSMSEAGQRALNVKSKVESAESVLAELETDVAKFDYSSYTETIKTQTQNVADRTGVYNSSVSRYEQKTQEMDSTFSNELIAATPITVPEPFDPSCLELGDDVHMKDGDIINFLEEYNAVELGGKLSDAQLENILAMLFDKKDIDVSRFSEEDFGIAFINLPEEQKKAVLLEMGYSNDQIESILESCKGQKGPAAGSAFARTLVDRIAGKNRDKYHNVADRTGLANALGLAGLKRPGDGTAKTHADAYDAAGGSKTKTGGNTGNNTNNSGSSSTDNNSNNTTTNNTTGNNTTESSYPIDEKLKAEADTYLDNTNDNYGDFYELKEEYERCIHTVGPSTIDEEAARLRAQQILTELGYIYYTLANCNTSSNSSLLNEFIKETCYATDRNNSSNITTDSDFIYELQNELANTGVDEIAYSDANLALGVLATDKTVHNGEVDVAYNYDGQSLKSVIVSDSSQEITLDVPDIAELRGYGEDCNIESETILTAYDLMLKDTNGNYVFESTMNHYDEANEKGLALLYSYAGYELEKSSEGYDGDLANIFTTIIDNMYINEDNTYYQMELDTEYVERLQDDIIQLGCKNGIYSMAYTLLTRLKEDASTVVFGDSGKKDPIRIELSLDNPAYISVDIILNSTGKVQKTIGCTGATRVEQYMESEDLGTYAINHGLTKEDAFWALMGVSNKTDANVVTEIIKGNYKEAFSNDYDKLSEYSKLPMAKYIFLLTNNNLDELERIAETLTETSYTFNNNSGYLHMLAVQHGYLAQKVADEVIKYYSGTNPDYNRVNHTLKENLEAYSGMMAFWLTLDKMYSDLEPGHFTISNLSKEDNMYTFHANGISTRNYSVELYSHDVTTEVIWNTEAANDFLNKSNMSDLSKEINELAAKYASDAFVGIAIALCPEAAVAVASAYGVSMLVGNNYSDSISSFVDAYNEAEDDIVGTSGVTRSQYAAGSAGLSLLKSIVGYFEERCKLNKRYEEMANSQKREYFYSAVGNIYDEKDSNYLAAVLADYDTLKKMAMWQNEGIGSVLYQYAKNISDNSDIDADDITLEEFCESNGIDDVEDSQQVMDIIHKILAEKVLADVERDGDKYVINNEQDRAVIYMIYGQDAENYMSDKGMYTTGYNSLLDIDGESFLEAEGKISEAMADDIPGYNHDTLEDAWGGIS